jgi:hypothetical protein
VNLVTGIISTVVGGDPSGGGDGGPAGAAQLSNATGVAVDPAGNLLIADRGASLGRIVSATPPQITVILPTPTVTVCDDGGTYNGFAFAATTTVACLSGVAADSLEGVSPSLTYYVGDTASGTGSADAPTGVGTYTVVASFAGSDDYAATQSSPVTFTIVAATPTVSVSVDDESDSGLPPAATATVAGVDGVPSSSLEGVSPTLLYYVGSSVSDSGSSVAPTATGRYTVVAFFAGSDDYTAAQSDPVTFRIGATQPTVDVSVADGTYSGLPLAATATVTGIDGIPSSSLEGVSPTLLYYVGSSVSDSGSSVAPTAVGTYTVVASFAGSDDYTAAQSDPVTFTIAAATPTVNVSNAGGRYSGLPLAATATVTGIDGVPSSRLEGVGPTFTYYVGSSVSGSGTAVAPTAVGAYTVVARFAGSADYTTAQSNPVTFTITPNSPTIAAVVVTESAAPKNGLFESNEGLRITWTVSSQHGIASQTVKVDGKPVGTTISGPAAGNRYNCVMGPFSVGSHTYTIRSTDLKGVSSTSSGTFTVVAPIPPAIGYVVITEAAAPKNSLFESNESLRITWTASSQRGIASQIVKVDGRPVVVTMGGAGNCYNYTIGPFSVGSHTYTIRSTDSKGVSSTSTGTFTVVAPVPPVIANVAVVEAAAPTNSTLEPNQKLSIRWTASSQRGIASQTVTVDGKQITPIKGPTGGLYSCAIGKYSAGSHTYTIKSTDSKGVSSRSTGTFITAADLTLETASVPKGSAESLSGSQLASIVAEAIQRLETQLGSQVEAALAGVKVEVANLSGKTLGEALGNTIWIDNNAAGYGWFVDPTPADDTEFVKQSGSGSLAGQKGTSAATRVDLLTTVMHEMGHVLGYNDDATGDLMDGALPIGIRRVAVDEVLATLHRE